MPLSIDEQRKKNQIGDQIIAERVDESDDEQKNNNQANIAAAAHTTGYRSRLSKITRLADESTHDHKQQLKELGIQRQTLEITQQAKANARKIEDYKVKLRQSAMGGVITNDLKNKLDKIQRLKQVAGADEESKEQLIEAELEKPQELELNIEETKQPKKRKGKKGKGKGKSGKKKGAKVKSSPSPKQQLSHESDDGNLENDVDDGTLADKMMLSAQQM